MIRHHLRCLAILGMVLAGGCERSPVKEQREEVEAGGAQPEAAPSGATAAESGERAANAADQAFIDGMVPHHEHGVMMADDALAKATSPELKAFAQKVKDDQGREIAQMKGWRQQWFGSGDTPPMDHGMMKPIAAGPDFDRQWAEEMITHHQGAIDMANAALTQASRPEVKQLAQRIIDAQKTEQDQLRGLLQTWGGTAAR